MLKVLILPVPPMNIHALMHTCRASDTAASADGDSMREDLKRDILLAHMLSLFTQQYMPAHALPALAAYLTDKGVMPQWVQVCFHPAQS